MKSLFRRVASCNGIELRKDNNGKGAIYVNGKLEYKGTEYFAGREYLNLKAKA